MRPHRGTLTDTHTNLVLAGTGRAALGPAGGRRRDARWCSPQQRCCFAYASWSAQHKVRITADMGQLPVDITSLVAGESHAQRPRADPSCSIRHPSGMQCSVAVVRLAVAGAIAGTPPPPSSLGDYGDAAPTFTGRSSSIIAAPGSAAVAPATVQVWKLHGCVELNLIDHERCWTARVESSSGLLMRLHRRTSTGRPYHSTAAWAYLLLPQHRRLATEPNRNPPHRSRRAESR